MVLKQFYCLYDMVFSCEDAVNRMENFHQTILADTSAIVENKEKLVRDLEVRVKQSGQNIIEFSEK